MLFALSIRVCPLERVSFQEGSVNKFLVDDKGVLLLVMFGLPPVYHLDDPVRGLSQ